MINDALFTPLQLGATTIPNRIIMAPMTRMRAGSSGIPTPLNAQYYAQRSTAGLIIAEGTAVSHQGQGYPSAPGIYTAKQIAGWRIVTEAVHASDGKIFLQIAHNGRNSHSSLLPDGSLPVAPSAIPPELPAFTKEFRQVPVETPRALETSEIAPIVDTFAQAAANAIEAGFDGIEIQAANSHLIDQFLQDGTNQRTDIYGGPAENRIRFLLEVVDKVSAAVGKDRLGVRLSPFGRYGGIHDSNPLHLNRIAIEALSNRQIAYLHLIEGRGSEIGLADVLNEEALNNTRLFRSDFAGPMISAGAYQPSTANQVVAEGDADAVAFGRLFIANPDLVQRLRGDRPMNPYDRSSFYGGGEHGYTDYPASPGV
jgi:N-ethylmaleimide reductase